MRRKVWGCERFSENGLSLYAHLSRGRRPTGRLRTFLPCQSLGKRFLNKEFNLGQASYRRRCSTFGYNLTCSHIDELFLITEIAPHLKARHCPEDRSGVSDSE